MRSQLLLQHAGEPIANQRAVHRLRGRADAVEQALHSAEQPRGAQGLPLGCIRPGQDSQTPCDGALVTELTAQGKSLARQGSGLFISLLDDPQQGEIEEDDPHAPEIAAGPAKGEHLRV